MRNIDESAYYHQSIMTTTPHQVLFMIPKVDPPEVGEAFSRPFRGFVHACLNKEAANVGGGCANGGGGGSGGGGGNGGSGCSCCGGGCGGDDDGGGGGDRVSLGVRREDLK